MKRGTIWFLFSMLELRFNISTFADILRAMEQKNNPLHGKTLEAILTELQTRYGWEGLAIRININCFKENPSIKSSLKFLRRTPWAREKVEALYLHSMKR